MRLEQENNEEFDIVELIEELSSKHRTVYWVSIFNEIFVYKPLGRRDYQEICDNEEMSQVEKEDEVCRKCLFYPNPQMYDFDEAPAGVIQKLFKKIMHNSYLDSIESRAQVLDYYREELFDFQNQIPCIINEAFPNFDIEDIENWDVERTAKYLSRAEFKLQNFRGMEINTDLIEEANAPGSSDAYKQSVSKKEQEDVKTNAEPENKKEALTPEKLRQLQAQFPEIDWTADTVANEGIKGMRDSYDELAPALRVGRF